MKIEEKFPLIDAYLTGHISDKENQEFAELRKSPEFEQEFIYRQEVHQAAKHLGRRELKARLQQLDRPAKTIQFKYWWVAAAAMLIALISLPFLFDSTSSQELYAEFYTKMPNKVVPITRGDDDPTELKMAFIQYQRGNYEEAKAMLKEKLTTDPDVAIYLGIIALENEEYIEAISILEPISQNKNDRFTTDASWYLALANLAESDVERTVQILTDITNSQSRYKLRAEQLLSRIKS